MAFSQYSFVGSAPTLPSLSTSNLLANSNALSMSNGANGDTRLQRPDKPLIVKCTFDRSMRRITFASAQNCSFDLLRTRVEQCFSLYASSFLVTYKDDDGEITDISCDDDLTEAITYFHLGDDGTSSYGGSSYSGYSSKSSGSSSSRKITLRVDVQVDYDGPSLSDTASLSSLDEYKERRRGSDDGSLGSYVNVGNDEAASLRSFGREIGAMEDDMKTLSSVPTIAAHSTGNSNVVIDSNAKSVAGSAASTESFSLLQRRVDAAAAAAAAQQPLGLPRNNSSLTLLPDVTLTPTKDLTMDLPPTQNSGVFERLKAAETTATPPLPPGRKVAAGGPPTGGTARWLKDQNVQMIQSVLGGVHTAASSESSSVSDSASNHRISLSSGFATTGFATEEDEGGIIQAAKEGEFGEFGELEEIPGSLELELGRNKRGSYYYTYTGSVLSHSGDDHEPEQGANKSQRQPMASTSSFTPSFHAHAESEASYFPSQEGQKEDLKYMQYLPPSQSSDTLVGPDPSELTECSSCGVILDTFRYVCATCGPRPPRLATMKEPEETEEDIVGKGKGRADLSATSANSLQPAGIPVPSNLVDSQSSPNFSQSSLSPSPAALSPGSSSYSPQRPIHDYGPHSPGHRHSHSHGSLFPPAPFHPPIGHPGVLGMNMGHLHPHMMLQPPHLHPHHSHFSPPSSSYPPPFGMQYPLQAPPSPGASTTWNGLDGGVPLSNVGQTLSAPSTNVPPGGSPNSTTGLLHNKPLPRIPYIPTYPPAYGAPPRSPASSNSSYPPPSSQQSPRSAQSPRQGSQHSDQSPASAAAPEGFELCTDCMETAGIEHASESVATGPDPFQPGHSPAVGNSPYAERASYTMPGSYAPGGGSSGSSTHSAGSGSWKRSVPRKKGQLRHAFKEKMWTPNGWIDVEHSNISKCTTCSSELTSERYKCATCLDMVVCRGCYSQIHEIHPIHAFLTVPEKKPQEPAPEPNEVDESGERSLSHSGVKCSHCLMEIVGARYHCAICPSVDICSNCESAGLPGNLTAPDGGHDSSHIMIKVPFPLSSNEMEAASRKALSLWTGRDAPNLQSTANNPSEGTKRSNSSGSNYAATVIGPGNEAAMDGTHRMDHGMNCNGCGNRIIGVRYQCAGCPSPDGEGYSLCVDCEAKSYQLHDPMHCFFKIPRPVDRKIQEDEPLLPPLYILAAGESLEETPFSSRNDPRAYLQTIVHRVALCDRCIQRIVGEWFHCAYCAKDLCDACEAMDSHDASHLFVVFKSVVDMSVLRTLTDVENPQASRPLIGYPVYTRPL